MMALQSNGTDYWAAQFNPIILKGIAGMKSMNSSEEEAYSLLLSWNYSFYEPGRLYGSEILSQESLISFERLLKRLVDIPVAHSWKKSCFHK